ncbi:MAG: hypothetical protein KF754_06870 [Planctomycetes bacterium]|nr:hypothetical protein [Planctomycetota bacterium]
MQRYTNIADAGDRELQRLAEDPQSKLRIHPRESLRAMQMAVEATQYLDTLWDKCFAAARLRLIAACGMDICEVSRASHNAWQAGPLAEESPMVQALRAQLVAQQPLAQTGLPPMEPPTGARHQHGLPDAMPEPAAADNTNLPPEQVPLTARDLKILHEEVYVDQISLEAWQPLQERALRENMNMVQMVKMLESYLVRTWEERRRKATA